MGHLREWNILHTISRLYISISTLTLTDAASALCEDDHKLCPDLSCVPISENCDNTLPCLKRKYSRLCNDGTRCFNGRFDWCDGVEHCPDGSDEISCGIFGRKWTIAIVCVVLGLTFLSIAFYVIKYCFSKKRASNHDDGSSRIASRTVDNRYAWYINSRENTSTANHPAESEHSSDVDSNFIPRSSDGRSNVHRQYATRAPNTASHSSTGAQGGAATHSWYDLSYTPVQQSVLAQPTTRSWYDISQGDGDTARSGSDAQPQVTRSWYDIPYQIDHGTPNEWSSTAFAAQRNTNPLNASDTGGHDIVGSPLGTAELQPPPDYHSVLNDESLGQEAPPTYESVMHRESAV